MSPFKASLGIAVVMMSVGTAAAPQEPSFNAQSNVVLVPTLVRDAGGKVVYGLQAKDFIIEDDGVEQVPYLDEGAEAGPVSVIIAVQCGRRARREFDRTRGLAAMLDAVLSQPDTETALVFFDSKLTLARDFTNNSKIIEGDLKNLEAGDNGAAILDAVAYSVKLLNQQPEGRQRVLLLISETRDHGSHFAKLDGVVKLIGVANVAVYALPFSPYVSQQLDAARGSNQDEWGTQVDIIEKLAAARQAMRSNTPRELASMSGGEYQLFASRKAFETSMNSFANHVHSRYLLSFEPKSPRPGLHQIRVRLKDPARIETVLFRSNYWAGSADQ
jgi:VWFA-related protein